MATFTQPRTWRTLQRHPVSARRPDLKGKALERMRDGVKKFGNVNERKVKLAPDPSDGGKIKVADGWQFYQACIEAGLRPDFEPVRLQKDLTLEEWDELVNDNRRHEDEEDIAKRIEERRAEAARLREQGESIRSIAEKTGVTPATTQRDLENAPGVLGGTPAPPDGKVTGKDGREQSSTKAAPVFCRNCRLNGPKKNCPDCKIIRDNARKERNGKAPREPGDDSEQEKAEKKKRQNNGKVEITWTKYETAFGIVARFPNVIKDVFKEEKQSAEYKEVVELLGKVAKTMKDWKKRLQKVKA
jgi:hypothetical protein